MAQPGLPLRAAGRSGGVTVGPVWASGATPRRRDRIPRLAAAMAAAAGLRRRQRLAGRGGLLSPARSCMLVSSVAAVDLGAVGPSTLLAQASGDHH
jgi:hypothetical protein